MADRPENFKPNDAIGFKHLLPLSEIIAAVLGVDSPSVQRVWSIYNPLVEKFTDEYTVLIDVSKEDPSRVAGEETAEAVVRVQEGRAHVVPGYDGVYGQLILKEQAFGRIFPRRVQQLNLTDFTL